jgi:mannitol/fructose-specific phosphotransferase system IIA component (Ntr-type)
VRSSTAAGVIAELADALEQAGHLNDQSAFVNSVMTRESLSPTSFSCGLAMPHARLHNLPELSFAVGRSLPPITWMSDKTARTRVVWLFAVPELETKTYLNLISAVARFSQNAKLMELFLRCPHAEAMYSILQQVGLLRAPSTMPKAETIQSLAARWIKS